MCKYCRYPNDYPSNGILVHIDKSYKLTIDNLPKKYLISVSRQDRSWKEHLWSHNKITIYKYGVPYMICFVNHPIKKAGYIIKDNVEYLIIVDSYEKITIVNLTNRRIKIKGDGKWY